LLKTELGSGSPWQLVAMRALKYLLGQWPLEFEEARHTILFPKVLGLGSRSRTHAGIVFRGALMLVLVRLGLGSKYEAYTGDIFQRALIADALALADAEFDIGLRTHIEREVHYLLGSRRRDEVGGWSYFPNLDELPPDADDLAQIMQLLTRTGRRKDLMSYCERPLEVLLRDCLHENGSFETWLIPRGNRTASQRRQAHFVNVAWGRGQDCEVNANLLYALQKSGLSRFRPIINNGVRYLESCQGDDGSWSSTWYHGPYYATYMCLRIIAEIAPTSSALRAALGFIEHNQLQDGGWGSNGVSDPLSTSLALLGVSCDVSQKEKGLAIATRGIEYLEWSTKSPDQWSDCPFIRMDVGRAKGRPGPVLTYKSRTVTAAFILKAAIAWSATSLASGPAASDV